MLPTTFGALTLGFHDPVLDPYHTLADDIELCLLAEDLGFDEFWIGEHHSGGWGTLSAPEMLLAAVARETSRIRLGTSVVPLTFHHPLHVAERILLLDHLSRGRAMLGCGPGALIQDMELTGVDPATIRPHFAAALAAVAALLRGETIDVATPWFVAREAQPQLRPYRGPIEIAVASSLGEESLAELAETRTSPLVNLTAPWGALRTAAVGDPVGQLAERVERYRARSAEPIRLRLNVFVHVCESTTEGVEEIFDGWYAQRTQMCRVGMGLPLPGSESANRSVLEATIERGGFIVGPPEHCVAAITELAHRLGGLDALTVFVPGWLPAEATERSLRAFGRYVIPHFLGQHEGTRKSFAAAAEHAGRRAEIRAAMASGAPVGQPA